MNRCISAFKESYGGQVLHEYHVHAECCSRSIGPVYSTIQLVSSVSNALSTKQQSRLHQILEAKSPCFLFSANATPHSSSRSPSTVSGASFDTIVGVVEALLYFLATEHLPCIVDNLALHLISSLLHIPTNEPKGKTPTRW